jgi:ABC-2 type transport system permease protein
MRGSVVAHLIFKDWHLHRLQISLSIAAGVLALAVLQHGGEVPFVLGSVWVFVSLIVLASMLPISAIVNERKKQTLAFLMSLPLSSSQYTTAKIVSTSAMFLAPWLTLLIAALVLINTRHILPHGSIPMIFILAMLPVVGFCLILGTVLVGESEGWGIAATVVCNSSYGVTWYLFSRVPSLTANWTGHVAVWNSTVLRVLSAEFGLIALFVGLTFFLQSRKRDFV